jgi:hypothetical protein
MTIGPLPGGSPPVQAQGHPAAPGMSLGSPFRGRSTSRAGLKAAALPSRRPGRVVC